MNATLFATPSPRPTHKLLTLLAWVWLFLPLLWMWPNARSLTEVLLSALLLMGILLSRTLTRIATVVLWLLGMCFLGYFFAVHSLPDEFFWQSILGSNATEAWEYFRAYRTLDALLMLAWGIPAALAACHLWRLPKALHSKPLRILAWVMLAIWTLWLGVSLAKGYDIYRIFSRVDRVYPLMMVKSWERYERNAELASKTVEIAPPAQPPMVDVLVVVLGESGSAHRWSMLGYTQQATNAPLQPWQQGLATLPLTTNGNNTGMTLPVIIAGQRMNPLPEGGIASYLDWGKAAGFHNVVLANQQAPGFANVALRLRSDQHLQLQDGKLDGDLTPLLTQTLQTAAAAKQPLLLTLHTYGSHPRVEKRVPEGYAALPDAYDNSIHYTSELLADWIQQLDALKGLRTALIYVSDHGQDFPVCGGSYVHGITRSTYEVPFLLWTNDTLRHQHPSWWKQWPQHAAHAITPEGIPRYNTLMPAQAIAQLLGYPAELPEATTPVPNGAYPPAEDAALCSDWYPQVPALHPAAAQ